MYSIVLAAFLTTGNEVSEFGRHHHGCYGGCYGSGYFYGCCGGCYGGGYSYGCCGGCYGGGYSYGCCGGCYGGGCSGASAGGTAAGGGGASAGGTAAGGGGASAGGASAGASGASSASGGGGSSTEVTQSLQELKKSLAELKDEQNKHRLEGLKRTIDELRAKEIEQKINELRRSLEDLKLRVAPETVPVPLPMPVPGRRTVPELPSPRSGKILLQVPADALVFVNDKRMSPASAFTTPPLEPGKESVYDFEVTVVRDGKNIARAKRLSLRAGEVVRLAYADMTSSDTNWTKEKAAAAPAHITVRLPADARLTVHGVDCPLTSEARTFDTPALAPGQEYFYILKIKALRGGRQVEQTQRVAFRSGERVTVSFDNAVAGNVAAQ